MSSFKNVIVQNTLTAGGVKISNLPPRKILSSDDNSNIISSSVSTDDLEYLNNNDISLDSTNEKFIGSVPIYRKLILVQKLPNATRLTIQTGIESANYAWVDIGNSFAFNSSGGYYPIPYTDPYDNNINGLAVMMTGNGSNLVISSAANWEGYSAYISIKYTKTTDL